MLLSVVACDDLLQRVLVRVFLENNEVVQQVEEASISASPLLAGFLQSRLLFDTPQFQYRV